MQISFNVHAVNLFDCICQTAFYYYVDNVGISSGIMVSKLDKQVFTSEFDSHWGFDSYGNKLRYFLRRQSEFVWIRMRAPP